METRQNYNFNEEQRELLISILKREQEELDFENSMEFGCEITEILEMLKNGNK